MIHGLYIGRFQPFHLGHLSIVKKAVKKVDELMIGICFGIKENHFSVEERMCMIKSTLSNNRITNYTLYPIQDYPRSDNKWVKEIEKSLSKIDVIFMSDKNSDGEKKVELAFNNKYKIKKLKTLKNIDGTTIREYIKKDKKWKHLVPKEVYEQVEGGR